MLISMHTNSLAKKSVRASTVEQSNEKLTAQRSSNPQRSQNSRSKWCRLTVLYSKRLKKMQEAWLCKRWLVESPSAASASTITRISHANLSLIRLDSHGPTRLGPISWTYCKKKTTKFIGALSNWFLSSKLVEWLSWSVLPRVLKVGAKATRLDLSISDSSLYAIFVYRSVANFTDRCGPTTLLHYFALSYGGHHLGRSHF